MCRMTDSASNIGKLPYPGWLWRPTQPGAGSYLSVKWTDSEADHSLPYTAEIKRQWSYTSTPSYILITWSLLSTRHNFTSTLWQYVKCERKCLVVSFSTCILTNACYFPWNLICTLLLYQDFIITIQCTTIKATVKIHCMQEKCYLLIFIYS
jgi:hypothetical protein